MSDSETLRHFEKAISIGQKLKRAMQNKGVKHAKAKCPECKGKWVEGTLRGARDHLHYSCSCGKYRMME